MKTIMKSTLTIAAMVSLFSVAAFADALRSDKHLVKIDAKSVGGNSRQYDVQVFDGESRNDVAHLKLTIKGDTPEEIETTANGTRYRVRIVPYGEAYLVEFTADNGQMIDTIRGGFSAPAKSKPADAKPARAGRDVNAPAVIRRVDAVYTEEAKAAGAAGSVIVEVLIDKSGFVRDARVLTPMGHGLSESALDAVKQWRFDPTKQDRKPVEVLHEVTIEFKP